MSEMYYKWFGEPHSEDQIDQFLNQVFTHTEQNVWSRILKQALKHELEESIQKDPEIEE